MLRNSWRPIIATTAVVGTGGYLYHAYSTSRAAKASFELPVRVKDVDGKKAMSTRTISLLPLPEVEKRLTANATSQSVPRPGGLVWKHTTASLASNDPIEDANAHALFEKDPSPDASNGDLLFFAVMDGHGGPHTSRLLSKTLIPAISLQLSRLREAPNSFMPKMTPLDNLKSMILGQKPPPTLFDADPNYVSLAIQTAFAMMDSEIINAPLRIVAEHLQSISGKEIPDLSQHPMALATMLPAISGSCALLTLLDTAKQDLYVACTGDCRAVAGVWEEGREGQGTWRVETLSEDQTGRNSKELQRIRSEHPLDEAPYVIQRGRILGGLEPSRAFGDARYKWPTDVQHLLSRIFLEGNGMHMPPAPQGLKTPPYVTSQPVITHRKLSFPPPSPSVPKQDASDPKSTLRFIVLATDGLWDQLSSAEVVSLVGGHLAGLSGSIPKKDLTGLVPTVISSDPSVQTVEGKGDRSRRSEDGAWAFVDENVSTHLIRNAFGGADKDKLRKMLSIPAPLSRNYRDDVTVTVVWWENGSEDFKKETIALRNHVSARL